MFELGFENQELETCAVLIDRTVSNVVNKLALEGSPREAKCGLRAVVSTSSNVPRFFVQLYKVYVCL